MSTAAGYARLAAQHGVVEVCLGLGGAPVTERMSPANWTQRGGSLSNVVTFGPYAERVDADAVLVYVADEGPDTLAIGGTLSLPPGIPFEFALSLVIGQT